MRNAEQFDPQKIRRYSVVHVYYEYVGQRGEEKYFIVLRQSRAVDDDYCWCIKATSRCKRYEADQDLLDSVVLYGEGVISFFTEKTVIDPASFLKISHSHLQTEAGRSRYRIAGQMPNDFHGRLVAALNKPFTLEPKTVKEILGLIGI